MDWQDGMRRMVAARHPELLRGYEGRGPKEGPGPRVQRRPGVATGARQASPSFDGARAAKPATHPASTRSPESTSTAPSPTRS